MDITIKVVIDLSPSTVETLKRFANPTTEDLARLMQLAEQAKELSQQAKTDHPRTTVGPDTFKGGTDTGETLETVDQVVPVKRSHKKKPTEEPVKADVQPTNGKTPTITLATVQALSKSKAQAGHAKAIKGFLAELDIEKVSELAVADLDDFHAKLAAL